MEKIKFLIRWIILLFIIYLVLITWNSKTHTLENFANNMGLEFVGAVLYPGKWLKFQVSQFWNDYIELRKVREQNKKLIQEIKKLKIQEIPLKIKAQEWERLRRLLKFKPLQGWDFLGARVLCYRLGPSNLLNSFVIDIGSRQGVQKDMPVLTPDGLLGKVLKTSLDFSTVLLISDSNSRVPVISRIHRTKGILQGLDSTFELVVTYVPITSPLDVGEVFLTSGLGGIFPKGIPVARTVKIENDPTSLFKKIIVRPTANFSHIEEVLVLKRHNLSSNKSKEDK